MENGDIIFWVVVIIIIFFGIVSSFSLSSIINSNSPEIYKETSKVISLETYEEIIPETPKESYSEIYNEKPLSYVNDDTTCDCSYNAYNCADFQTEREAQQCFIECGGVSNDVHRLDRDKDGKACEALS